MKPIRPGLAPRMKPVSAKRSAVVCALDIGTSKIVCLIGRLKPRTAPEMLRQRSHAIEVLGIGHTRARGIKAGTVVDMAEAEEAVRQAVHAAERMAGVHIEAVLLSISAGRMTSELYAATVDLSGVTVTDHDIERVLAAGSHHSVRPGRTVLHSLPIAYVLDGTGRIRDPRGMIGKRLGVDMHVVTADAPVARNLMLTVERCHLAVEAVVATPYASALAVLADDEAELGAAVIDMGAGTTTMAVFSRGRFVNADGFALGGNHVTMDLARGLAASIADAERIKTLHGCAISGASDDRDVITIASVGADEREPPHLASRSALVRIIHPRIEEILEMAFERLGRSQFAADPRGRVVLTGGASQLAGVPELAARFFGRQVRVGRPLGVAGLPEAAKGPAFAACAGLLVYPQAAHLEHFEPRRTRHLMTGTDGYFARVGRWLRESF
jgi:cell division protein FtsA